MWFAPGRLSIALAAIALCPAAAGCGQAASASVPQHGPAWTPVTAPREHLPKIVGGTPAQRTLVLKIAQSMTVSQLSVIRIAPASPAWRPAGPADVQLIATERHWTPRHQNERAEWETGLIAGAFRDRSAAIGLPRVVAVDIARVGGSRIWPRNGHAPSESPRGAAALQRRIIARLSAAGFHSGYVQVGTPDGYAVAIDIRTARAGWFLQHRKKVLDRVIQPYAHTDGLLLTIDTPAGLVVHEAGGLTRDAEGFIGTIPKYESCDPDAPYGDGVPMAGAPKPPPCPRD